jgi:hypothetical protein
MIGVPMGVDQESGRLITNGSDGCPDLISQSSVLAVYHKDAIFTGADTDIPSGTGQHVDPFRESICMNLNLIEVLLCAAVEWDSCDQK